MRTALFIFLLIVSEVTHAQLRARRYLARIVTELGEVEKQRQAYTASFVSFADPVQLESDRRLLLRRTAKAVQKVAKMKPYHGSTALRDSLLVYLGFTYASAAEEFVTVADMEAISEMSHDAMETYLLARESAYRGLRESGLSLNHAIARFAGSNRIAITTETHNPHAGQRVDHYNLVYDIYFRCYKQEQYLIEAIKNEDILATEQNRKSLQKVSRESILRLQALKQETSELPLHIACREVLEFYYHEARELSGAANFIGDSDYFSRLKKAFLSAPETEQTGEKLQILFSAVADLSEKGAVIENTMATLASRRAFLSNQWNQRCREYLEAVE